jgi:hypothetical protein
MNSNIKKSKFLGIPHGTAVAKLRKSILFKLVQQTEQDNCFRCNDKIKSVAELSIEHKQPWENVSIELFWDLDNIAFSHLKCNRPHNTNAKIGTEGTAWCTDCKNFLLEENFHADKNSRNGKQHYCKQHKRNHRY